MSGVRRGPGANYVIPASGIPTMIFNKSGRIVKDTHFYCQGETLEITESQTYLGLVFTPSGKFWLARETLSKKGQIVFLVFIIE